MREILVFYLGLDNCRAGYCEGAAFDFTSSFLTPSACFGYVALTRPDLTQRSGNTVGVLHNASVSLDTAARWRMIDRAKKGVVNCSPNCDTQSGDNRARREAPHSNLVSRRWCVFASTGSTRKVISPSPEFSQYHLPR